MTSQATDRAAAYYLSPFGDPSIEDNFRVGGTYLTKDGRKAVLVSHFDGSRDGRPFLAIIEDGEGNNYARQYQEPEPGSNVLHGRAKLIHGAGPWVTPTSKDDLVLPPKVVDESWINIFSRGAISGPHIFQATAAAFSSSKKGMSLLHRLRVRVFDNGNVDYSVHDIAADHAVTFSTPQS